MATSLGLNVEVVPIINKAYGLGSKKHPHFKGLLDIIAEFPNNHTMQKIMQVPRKNVFLVYKEMKLQGK